MATDRMQVRISHTSAADLEHQISQLCDIYFGVEADCEAFCEVPKGAVDYAGDATVSGHRTLAITGATWEVDVTITATS